jgi:hypothetical protein
MPVLDVRNDVLKTLASQGASPRALGIAEAVRAKREAIANERYNGQREREELDRVNAEAVDELRATIAEAELLIDQQRDRELANFETDQRKRAEQHLQLGDVVDVTELRTTEDPDLMARLVAEAERHGDSVGEGAKAIAIPRLKKLAIAESRAGRLNGRAFQVLNRLTVKGTSGRGSHADIVERFAGRKRTAVAMIGDVAAVVGLADRLKAAMRQAAVAPTPQDDGRFVVGRYWQRRPM